MPTRPDRPAQLAIVEDTKIKAVVNAHHAAIETRNLEQLAALWLQGAGRYDRSIGVAHVVRLFKAEGARQLDLVETDVLAKRDGQWLIVSHTKRPI